MDDKEMYEVLFCMHDSAHKEESKSSMFSEESRQYQNTGFRFFCVFFFFRFYQDMSTLGHNYRKMARIRTINLKNRKLW